MKLWIELHSCHLWALLNVPKATFMFFCATYVVQIIYILEVGIDYFF